MKYKLIALDLDGTLTDDAKEVPPHTVAVLHRAIEKGAAVALVSGRPTIGMERVAKTLELERTGGYILAYNGGHILDCRTGRDLYKAEFPRDCIQEAVEFARKSHVAMVSYDGEGIVTEGPLDQYVQHESYNNGIPYKQVADLPTYLSYPFVKMVMCGAPEVIGALEPAVAAHFAGRLDIYRAESIYLEIMPRNIRKSTGLQRLMDHLGIQAAELMACGDAHNDLPMMEMAGLSVAMENAYENVKKAAHFITKSNNEEGVAYAVEKFVLNGETPEV